MESVDGFSQNRVNCVTPFHLFLFPLIEAKVDASASESSAGAEISLASLFKA